MELTLDFQQDTSPAVCLVMQIQLQAFVKTITRVWVKQRTGNYIAGKPLLNSRYVHVYIYIPAGN